MIGFLIILLPFYVNFLTVILNLSTTTKLNICGLGKSRGIGVPLRSIFV